MTSYEPKINDFKAKESSLISKRMANYGSIGVVTGLSLGYFLAPDIAYGLGAILSEPDLALDILQGYQRFAQETISPIAEIIFTTPLTALTATSGIIVGGLVDLVEMMYKN